MGYVRINQIPAIHAGFFIYKKFCFPLKSKYTQRVKSMTKKITYGRTEKRSSWGRKPSPYKVFLDTKLDNRFGRD